MTDLTLEDINRVQQLRDRVAEHSESDGQFEELAYDLMPSILEAAKAHILAQEEQP